jgi:outer membrane protein TolC
VKRSIFPALLLILTIPLSASPLEGWWAGFNDPVITSFARTIQGQNLDIRIAESRLNEARAAAQTPRAAQLPTISLVGRANKGNVQAFKDASISQIGIQGEWNLDLFGRTHNQIRAADARVTAQRSAVQDARNRIISQLVQTLISWRENRDVYAAISQEVDEIDTQIHLLDVLSESGLGDRIRSSQLRVKRSQVAAQLPAISGVLTAAIYQTEQLMGVTDNSVAAILQQAPTISMQLPVAEPIDTDTIKNRPDVQLALADLVGSRADLAAAEAAVWPQISVSGTLVSQAADTSIFQTHSKLWEVSAGVAMPLLDFGKLGSLIKANDAHTQSALAAYQAALVEAFKDTRTTFSYYTNQIDSLKAWEAAENAQKDLSAIILSQYNSGMVDLVTASSAKADYYQITAGVAQQRAAAARAYCRLQESIGN